MRAPVKGRSENREHNYYNTPATFVHAKDAAIVGVIDKDKTIKVMQS
jgi:hypothetical protein